MNLKYTMAALAAVLSLSSLVACSKDTPAGPGSHAQSGTKAPLAARAPALPSVYLNPEYRPLAEAADQALSALLAGAKDSTEPAKVAPLIKDFVSKRDALLRSIHDAPLRSSAFREIMQKTLRRPEDRKVYAHAMTEFYKTNKSPAVSQVAPVALKTAVPLVAPKK